MAEKQEVFPPNLPKEFQNYSTHSLPPKTYKTRHKEDRFLFADLCNMNVPKRYGIDFRQFGRVMYDLWHFVENCHKQGLRLGNLRPQDLLIKISYEEDPDKKFAKPAKCEFSLMNPENTAKVDAEKKLVRNYTRLDMNFVHPDYAKRMATDDEARLDQDWYSFSVLCCWFVTKFDPFGAGVVKEKPDADRIYRMEKVLCSQSSRIDIDERYRSFIVLAIGRLSPMVVDFVERFMEQESLRESSEFLLEEFRDDNIITCKAEIFKRYRSGKVRKVQCGFKQLNGFNTCGYCEAPHVKMISVSHQLYQTEDQAATV
jgi:hypothetical protein